MGKWSIAQQPLSIAYKELFPIVVAAMLWGHRWATKRVEFYLDNMAVLSVLCSSTSKDPNMMVLLHYLSLVAAHNFFAFTASYTPGQDNSIADALSCFDFQRFHHLAPHAAHMAIPLPPPSSFSRMAILCRGPFYLHFCKPPYRQLAFLRSSQVTALELALLLRPPTEAFLTTSLRPWVAG